MDTSTAQEELGWLLDPPEDGVSVWGGHRLKASGKWGGEVGGGTEKKAGKTGSVSSERGRGDESEPPEWDIWGGGQASPHGELHAPLAQ